MKIIKKGSFGYIKQRKKTQSLLTLFLLILSFGIYYMGVKTTGSNKNLLTYVAILGCLPMAKFAVNAYMFLKAKGCSENLYSSLQTDNVVPLFYDLYFTSYKKNFQVSALYYKKKNLIMITEDEKTIPEEAENHLKDMLKNCGVENVTVKMFSDSSKFIQRYKELEMLLDDEKDNTFLYDNILSVSL